MPVHHAPQVDRLQEEALPGPRRGLDHEPGRLPVRREDRGDLPVDPPLVGFPRSLLRAGVRRWRPEQGFAPGQVRPELFHGHRAARGLPCGARGSGPGDVHLPEDAGDLLEHLPVFVYLLLAQVPFLDRCLEELLELLARHAPLGQVQHGGGDV